jgi:hypothetical protein
MLNVGGHEMDDKDDTPARGYDPHDTPPHGITPDKLAGQAAQTVDEADDDHPVSLARRQLLLRLLIGGGAALAAGGGTAVLLNRSRQVIVIPGIGQVSGSGLGEASARLAALEGQLTAVIAERDQLVGELASAQAEISRLSAELDQTAAERDHLRELNALWEALDSVGLDDIVAAGLAAVAGVLSPLLVLVTLVLNNLRLGKDLLGDFTDNFPTPQAGIAWLKGRVVVLANDLDWLAEQVQQAVEPIEPFATLLLNFVLFVLDKLPFGAGQKARAGLDAMHVVLTSLPDVIDGVNGSVLDPLGDWFGDDEDKTLIATLIGPLIEKVIEPTETLTTRIASLNTTYQDDLSKPTEEALEQRAAIRAQIDALVARGKTMGQA